MGFTGKTKDIKRKRRTFVSSIPVKSGPIGKNLFLFFLGQPVMQTERRYKKGLLLLHLSRAYEGASFNTNVGAQTRLLG